MGRRKKNAPPRLRHMKARNRAFVEVDGHRTYLGKWGTPEVEERYNAFVAQFYAAGQRQPVRATDAVAVVQVVDAFWEHTKRRCSQSEAHVCKAAMRVLNTMYGETAAASFGPLDLKAIEQAVAARGRHPRTVKHYSQRIRKAFKHAVVLGWYDAGKLANLSAVAGERFYCEVCAGEGTCDACRTRAERRRDNKRLVSDIEFAAVTRHTSDTITATLRFIRHTGVRVREALRMRPGDIDRSVEPWIYIPPTHKNAHRDLHRAIPVGPQARAVLAPLLVTTAVDAPVFDIREASLRRAVVRVCEARSIPRWVPKDLRNTRGQFVNETYGPAAAKAVLGHQTLGVTEKFYLSPDWKLASEVSEATG